MIRWTAILVLSTALLARAESPADTLARSGIAEFTAAYQAWDGARFGAAAELFRQAGTNAPASAINFYWLGAAQFHRMLQLQSLPPSRTNTLAADKAMDAALAAHRLDIVLTDEPASSSANFKTFNHLLGETGTTICAEKKLAAKLKPNFPKSLHEAPALLPADNTALRRALEAWFREQRIQPRVVAEFEDLALMKVMAAEGRGFIAVPSIAVADAVKHYQFQIVGVADRCRVQFHAVTAERRIMHPAVALITTQARVALQG